MRNSTIPVIRRPLVAVRGSAPRKLLQKISISLSHFSALESDADETLSSHRSESRFRTVFCLAEARLMLAFACFGAEALFLMGSKGDVKHSVCAFFAWHGLESCWCFGLFESDADETLSSHRSESTFRKVFCLAEARLMLAFACFGAEALFFIVFYGFQR